MEMDRKSPKDKMASQWELKKENRKEQRFEICMCLFRKKTPIQMNTLFADYKIAIRLCYFFASQREKKIQYL